MYWLIDRETNQVRKTKQSLNRRALHKPVVWLEVVHEPPPAYDSRTQFLKQETDIPDLSDLSVPVPEDAKIVIREVIVNKSAQQMNDEHLNEIAATDGLLNRIIEDIMVAIANGDPLTRHTFPEEVWHKINRRRQMRGQRPV